MRVPRPVQRAVHWLRTDLPNRLGTGGLIAAVVALLVAGVAVRGATPEARGKLTPGGTGPSGNAQVSSVGGASVRAGLRAGHLDGDPPAEIANSIDQLRQRLFNSEPQHILVVSSDRAGYAMPAAA